MKINHQEVATYRIHGGVGFALYGDGTLFRRQVNQPWEHIKPNQPMMPVRPRASHHETKGIG